jgi:ABC-type polysaccharide/polyol phosphate transport system ATPase subunit
MSDVSISINKAGIRFEGKTQASGIKDWLKPKKKSTQAKSGHYVVDALQDIDINITSGERVGLIGLNGAGKSTLLKVMAKIYPVTSGSAITNGHVCPMFEFATGFEMNQSGWDNIRIRGLLLGMQPAEVEEKIQEIADFTELGEFLDYPVRTYSAGMFIRLAFAVSTSVNPEILLIDEVMGAGDIRFAEKAKKRMFEFMEQGKILVFASHSFELLSSFCERTIWIEQGRVVADGKTLEVCDEYKQSES